MLLREITAKRKTNINSTRFDIGQAGIDQAHDRLSSKTVVNFFCERRIKRFEFGHNIIAQAQSNVRSNGRSYG